MAYEGVKNEIRRYKGELEMKMVEQTMYVIEFLDKIGGMMNDEDYKLRKEKDDGKEAVLIEYYSVFKKKPFGWWSIDEMKIRIADERKKMEVSWASLDTKQKEWKKTE